MSKRKQIRPAKFDARKKDDDQNDDDAQSESTRVVLEGGENRSEEVQNGEEEEEKKAMEKGESNIADTVAAVVSRTLIVSGVIQRTVRKRPASDDRALLSNGIQSSSRMEEEKETGTKHKRSRVGAELVQRFRNQEHVAVNGRHDSDEEMDEDKAQYEPEQRTIQKRFTCHYCDTKFGNPKTLEAHEAIYCTKRPTGSTTAQASASDARQSSSSEGHPNMIYRNDQSHCNCFSPPAASSVILLPCAYTGSNGIEIIGKPQTVIPVAIPSAYPPHFTVNPLIVEEAWCTGLDIPNRTVHISATGTVSPAGMNGQSTRNRNNKFALPIAIRPIDGRLRLLEQHRRQARNEIRSPPLDLSTKPSPPITAAAAVEYNCRNSKRRSLPHLNMEENAGTQMISPSPCLQTFPSTSTITHPKNFACPKCGVAFCSRKTLDGHQAFYCKARQQQTGSNLISPTDQKSSSVSNSQSLCCQYCDHNASTAWQLVQYMKNSHSLGSAFSCIICGYRGFSTRGMKSHLKHAHPDQIDGIDEESLLSKLVKRTEMFSGFDQNEPDEEARSNSSSGGASVDEMKRENHTPKLDNGNDEDFQRNRSISVNSDGRKVSNDRAPCGQLESKYSCQFCGYKSPYKGNVKRHLNLVHKMDKQKSTG